MAPQSDIPQDDVLAARLRTASRDPRAVRILAKTLYRELRQSGLEEPDVMALAGELLSLLTADVKDRRRGRSAAIETGANAAR